jgi:hypothetical protein
MDSSQETASVDGGECVHGIHDPQQTLPAALVDRVVAPVAPAPTGIAISEELPPDVLFIEERNFPLLISVADFPGADFPAAGFSVADFPVEEISVSDVPTADVSVAEFSNSGFSSS